MDKFQSKIAALLEISKNESISVVVLGYIGVLVVLCGLLFAAYTTIGYEALKLFIFFLFLIGFVLTIGLAIDNVEKNGK